MLTKHAGGIAVRSMQKPDERRTPPLSRMDVVTMSGTTLKRVVAAPGWRWSTCVGALTGTSSCPETHTGYVVAGRLRIRMDDGAQREVGAGEMFTCGPGHDAWVVGDEPAQFLEISVAGAAVVPQPRSG
jgi:mannose-6-phosphate isomerase-like protein (cupin superfamily)